MKSRTTLCTLLLAVLAPLASGQVLAASDTAEMETKIQAALVEKLGSDASTIRAAFYDGKAVLSGKVVDQSTQELAKEVALWVPGVTKVENQVENSKEKVVFTGKVLAESDDAALEGSVKTALKNEIGKYSSDVEVEACNGVVSIRGTMPDQARHDLAIAAATKVGAVKKLIDLLRVPN